MKNRLTFTNVINILLENKKKTYPQHKLICDLFAEYLGTSDYSDTIYADDNTMYSRWCTGARPIPMEILHTYEDDNNWGYIETSFDDEIIPNLINESQARSQMEELIKDSIPVIGISKADELIALADNAAFFTQVIRYAILSDHEHSKAFSPDLSEDLQNCFLPSVSPEFVGRKDELKQTVKLLQDNHVIFISGIAGIGKSEFARFYADKNRKKYTNIIYWYYTGDLKKNIIQMDFADDTADMSEDELFQRHYDILKKLRDDSLIILDNFNVLPKDDAFFKELEQNRFQLLVTTRCTLNRYPMLVLKELDIDKELTELFYKLCPSAKDEADVIGDIIKTVHSHTLTVVLSALSLSASGMEASELLRELETCGLDISDGNDIELFKDGDYTEGLMTEHLRKLLQLGKLSNLQLDILRNLSLLSLSGVLKNAFRNWCRLPNLNDVNHLARYGFIYDDTENRKISLHPLIQEIVVLETVPTVSACHTMIDNLHVISLAHGLDVKKPQNVIDSLISIAEHVIVDSPEYFLLFLQDMFPYLAKYLVTDYLPKLVDRIEYTMNQMEQAEKSCKINDADSGVSEHSNSNVCDRALLLDYKAELLVMKKDYKTALKKRQKAINIMESAPLNSEKASLRTVSLLSNLYNNLSNIYVLMKNPSEVAAALKKAISIRSQHNELGLMESHDLLQQLINLTNMLILAKDYDMAAQVLTLYENTVLEHEGSQTFDYGICQFMNGVLALSEGIPAKAETYLLSAETIIADVMGTDNEYTKSVYKHLYNLYVRWHKPELADSYRNKLLSRPDNPLLK